MRRISAALTLTLALLSGCGFDVDEPEDAIVRLQGPAGDTVELVFSTQFVAGVDQAGVTNVQVFGSDTLVTTLPMDTVISIRDQFRLFMQLTPLGDRIDVAVRVDIDDRNQFDDSGIVQREDPFRFVYLFNQPFTQNINVLF